MVALEDVAPSETLAPPCLSENLTPPPSFPDSKIPLSAFEI